ncbi:Hemolymph protein 14, partial [Operophtera brumata]
CGIVSPDTKLVVTGPTSRGGEVPWHALIYTKTTKPNTQICATCFWSSSDDVLLPASQFAVAVGKIKEIAIPLRFQGMNANYQDNLAVLVVSKPFVYNTYVQPLYLFYMYGWQCSQIAGWDCEKPTVLQVKELKFLDVTNCMNESPRDFIKYITSDKIKRTNINSFILI